MLPSQGTLSMSCAHNLGRGYTCARWHCTRRHLLGISSPEERKREISLYLISITRLILASTKSKEHESLRFSATAVEEEKGRGYKRIWYSPIYNIRHFWAVIFCSENNFWAVIFNVYHPSTSPHTPDQNHFWVSYFLGWLKWAKSVRYILFWI